jgi:predicted nucleic acid-binding protein
MSLHLLDSDAIIDFLKGFASTAAFIQDLPTQGHISCSCDIVVAEVYAGLAPRERARAQQFLVTLQFLPTSEVAAQQAGLWRYDFARRGVTLPATDTIIAAVAFEHGATVVTGNVRHYPMTGLTIAPLPRVRTP